MENHLKIIGQLLRNSNVMRIIWQHNVRNRSLFRRFERFRKSSENHRKIISCFCFYLVLINQNQSDFAEHLDFLVKIIGKSSAENHRKIIGKSSAEF